MTTVETHRHYSAAAIPKVTGLTLPDALYLEHLGVFPASACHHDIGRFWIAREVDEFVAFAAQAGVREWVASLLPGKADSQSEER